MSEPERPNRQQQALAQCEHLQRDFAKRANRHKRRYRTLQYISLALAVATTVLSTLAASQIMLIWSQAQEGWAQQVTSGSGQ
jgi:hypothetical protein